MADETNTRSRRKMAVNWVLGVLIANLGVCLSTKSGLGMSMIGAMPYVLHRWGWASWGEGWFTQGTAEYVMEAIILIVTCLIVRGFRPRYLLSFLTAVISGLTIDGWFLVLGGNGVCGSMALRVLLFILGMLVTALGIAFFFRTDWPLQVYELCVAEVTERYRLNRTKVKYVFDASCLVLAVVMSLVLLKGLTGVGIATVIIVLCNSGLIAFFGKCLDKLGR